MDIASDMELEIKVTGYNTDGRFNKLVTLFALLLLSKQIHNNTASGLAHLLKI
jgi:hypothetical protein